MKKIFIAFVIVALAACSKDQAGKNQFANFSYKQTYCADPWPTGSTDSITLVNVGSFLSSQSITVDSLHIKQDGPPALCLACQCKTGKTIYASVLAGDSLKMTAIGFVSY